MWTYTNPGQSAQLTLSEEELGASTLAVRDMSLYQVGTQTSVSVH